MKMTPNKRAIDKIYKRRDRYEIPEWQRQEVWSKAKKQLLIDTILRGWKLPKFYFLKNSSDPEEYEVLDGQQRLASIYEFFENELPLSPKSAKRFGGSHYRDLRDKYTDRFDDYEIEFDEIEDADDKEIREFFQRLQEGLPLTSSEKLNSIDSKLRDFVKQLTKHDLFKRVGASDKRYGHFDILAKTAVLEIDGIDAGLRYDEVRAVFETQAGFSATSNVAKRITGALDFLDRGFTADEAKLLRNRTIVQSLLTLACCLIQGGCAAGKERKLAEFFSKFSKELNRQVELGQRATDLDYLAFQRTVNANVKSGARTRNMVLIRKLLAFDPTFADALTPIAVVTSGLNASVKQDAEEIAALISRLNETYSSKHGCDLFKPTNKTSQAQIRIGRAARTYEEYKALVDDLYFLFHEGVGERLADKAPQSFLDINSLRTESRHDLDHGKASKSRAKRKKIGDVFKKYSGATSPSVLAPERFPVVQSNLLGAIKADLASLVF
jgi:hypothetical protein